MAFIRVRTLVDAIVLADNFTEATNVLTENMGVMGDQCGFFEFTQVVQDSDLPSFVDVDTYIPYGNNPNGLTIAELQHKEKRQQKLKRIAEDLYQ